MRTDNPIQSIWKMVFCIIGSIALILVLYPPDVLAQDADPNGAFTLEINGELVQVNALGGVIKSIPNGQISINSGVNADGTFDQEVILTIQKHQSDFTIEFDGERFDDSQTDGAFGVFSDVIRDDNNVSYKATLTMDKDRSIKIDINEVKPPGITLSDTSLSINEIMGQTELTVVLDTPPSSKVVLFLFSSDESKLGVDPSELIFTNDDWNKPKVVTVSSKGGDAGTTDINIIPDTERSDQNYHSVREITSVTTSEIPPGITLSDTSLSINEIMGQTELTVVLDTPPSSKVVLFLFSSDESKLGVDPSELIFTNDDWNKPKVVTVSSKGGDAGTTDINIIPDTERSDSTYRWLNQTTSASITTSFVEQFNTEEPFKIDVEVKEVRIQGVALETFLKDLKENSDQDQELNLSELTFWAEAEGILHSSDKLEMSEEMAKRDKMILPLEFLSKDDIPENLIFHLGPLSQPLQVTLKYDAEPIVVDFSSDDFDNRSVLSLTLRKSLDTPGPDLIRREYLAIAVLILIALSIRFSSRVQAVISVILGPMLPFSRSEVQQGFSSIERRLDSMSSDLHQVPVRRQQGNLASSRLPSTQNVEGPTNLQLQQELTTIRRDRDRIDEELTVERDRLRVQTPQIRNLQDQIDRSESEKRRLEEENQSLINEATRARDEQGRLPDVIQARMELSSKVTELGGRLNDVVAELVAEFEVGDRTADVNQEYWAVEDRRRLLSAVAEWLETQDRERSQNAERIARNIQQLEALNVRQGLPRIRSLSEEAGAESSAIILAILDDMLQSVPQRTISAEVVSLIAEYSAHVETLGINTRAIPRALIDICRELTTNVPPEEVAHIELVVERVIELARTRF